VLQNYTIEYNVELARFEKMGGNGSSREELERVVWNHSMRFFLSPFGLDQLICLRRSFARMENYAW
jgi:hypothetical protein